MPSRPPCRRRPSPPPRPASPARRRGRRPVPGKTNGNVTLFVDGAGECARRRAPGRTAEPPYRRGPGPRRWPRSTRAAGRTAGRPYRPGRPAALRGVRGARHAGAAGGVRVRGGLDTPVRNHCVGGPERKGFAPGPNCRSSPTSVLLKPGQCTSGSPVKPSNCGTWESPTRRSPAASASAPAPSSRPSSGSGMPRDVFGGWRRPRCPPAPCAVRPPPVEPTWARRGAALAQALDVVGSREVSGARSHVRRGARFPVCPEGCRSRGDDRGTRSKSEHPPVSGLTLRGGGRRRGRGYLRLEQPIRGISRPCSAPALSVRITFRNPARPRPPRPAVPEPSYPRGIRSRWALRNR